MSYNGSGTFQINSAGQPVVTGTVISSTAFNALTADLATGLSTAITKDGQTTTTVRVPFAAGISSTLTTDATSATTGSIITAGGISTQKALWVGTTSRLVGAVTADAGISSTLTTDATSATTGSIITAGGISCQKAAVVGTKLGVGMAPSNVVDILNTQNAATVMSIKNANASGSALTQIKMDNGTYTAGLSLFGTGFGNTGFNAPNVLQVGCSGDGIGILTTQAKPILFGINNAETGRFNSSGYLLVGRTTSSTGATNNVEITASSVAAFTASTTAVNGSGAWSYQSRLTNSLAGDTSGIHFVGVNDTTNVVLVRSDGNITNQNNSYGAISDRALKQDIEPAKSQWDDIKALAGAASKYHLKSNPDGPLQIGLIAQDVQEISPGLVDTDRDGSLSVNYSVLYMKAVKALGEALERIEALEAKVGKL